MRSIVIAGVLLVVSGCTRQTPATLADSTTRALYDNDPPAVRRLFVANVREAMSDESVANVSKMMHRYGEYESVHQLSEGPQPRRYDFEAQFERGSMLLQFKLDANGEIAGYRLIPNETSR